MKFHWRAFDGRFWLYLYAGPVRVTLWRSNLFHRRLGGCVGIIFDAGIVAAIIIMAVYLVRHFGHPIAEWIR